jgi:hypothetical protein
VSFSFSCATGTLLRSIVLFSTLLVGLSAFAVLGEDVSSVQADGARIKAAVNVLTGRSYSVHDMLAPDGTAVKEFVSPAGQVFGIAWQGPATPDLRQWLGGYFDQCMQAAQTTPRIYRGVLHVETGDLVVEAAGHMRFKVGRAYLRSKLPEGVVAENVR